MTFHAVEVLDIRYPWLIGEIIIACPCELDKSWYCKAGIRITQIDQSVFVVDFGFHVANAAVLIGGRSADYVVGCLAKIVGSSGNRSSGRNTVASVIILNLVVTSGTPSASASKITLMCMATDTILAFFVVIIGGGSGVIIPAVICVFIRSGMASLTNTIEWSGGVSSYVKSEMGRLLLEYSRIQYGPVARP